MNKSTVTISSSSISHIRSFELIVILRSQRIYTMNLPQIHTCELFSFRNLIELHQVGYIGTTKYTYNRRNFIVSSFSTNTLVTTTQPVKLSGNSSSSIENYNCTSMNDPNHWITCRGTK
ncbi:hypothetical protein KSF78_0001608 [Schistosoma japonicum]|nr:hypothetical protein KSF78_0001608 [Schistosoma japonicum]